MSKLSMAEIKAMAKDRNSNSGGSSYKNSDVYPFWKMNPDQEALVRFLPDADERETPMPFVEKLEHRLAINGKTRKIPCPTNYGHKCPICDLSQEYYKAEGKKSKNGKYYWRDTVHLARAIILKDPLPVDSETGENFEGKVATLQLGYQIHEKIMAQLTELDDDDPVPWGLDEGFNFKIHPIKQGDYKKYDLSSTFERKPSEIPEEYLENIGDLVEIRSLLPEEVTYDQANEFLDQHLSGGVGASDDDDDDDSLANKRKSGKSTSSREKLINRMSGDDDDEDGGEELDEDLKDVVDGVKDEEQDNDNNDDDDDDDDDDDELKRIIAKRRKGKK